MSYFKLYTGVIEQFRNKLMITDQQDQRNKIVIIMIRDVIVVSWNNRITTKS